MSAHTEFGVMHPGGDMIGEPKLGYPFRTRRMALALAADLDDDCECGQRGHVAMERTVGEWCTLSFRPKPGTSGG